MSVLGGIVVGMFGLPLGFRWCGNSVGRARRPPGTGGCIFRDSDPLLVTGVAGMGLGLIRMLNPDFWDYGRIGQFLDLLSPATQGGLLVFLFMAVAAAGLGMLWLSKRLLKGLRFLFDLMLDRAKALFRRRRRHVFARDGGWVKSPAGEGRSEEDPLTGSSSYSPIR